MEVKTLRRRISARWATVVLALILVVGLLTLRVDAGRLRSQTPPPEPSPLEASGVFQTDEIAIASELGGRIAAVPVDEGQSVAAGDVIVQLDTALIDAEIAVAQAQLEMAEAGLAQARAGVASTQIAVAEAQLAQAQVAEQAAEYDVAQAVAVKDGAEAAKNQAAAVVERFGDGRKERVQVGEGDLDDILDELPSEIVDELPQPPGDLPSPEGVYTRDDWELHIDDGSYRLFKWIGFNVPTDAYLAPHYWWQAWVGVNAATIQQEGLEATLADLYAQRAHPQTLDAQADEALRLHAETQAQAAMAEAQVNGMREGATEEELAVVEAQVAQARAAVAALEEKRALMTLTAPITGTVLDVVLYPGEVASKGAILLTLADLETVTLELYIPQTQLGQVYLGQPVQVTVDSFPARTFDGRVQAIADRAEFTPRNVATQEERVNLVFAVRVTLPNPDGALKPGMPADAVFERVDQPGRDL